MPAGRDARRVGCRAERCCPRSTDLDPFPAWFAALETRHLKSLSFAEVRRGLQALSALYVRRGRGLAEGTALEGAGKRAAFALFYAPLHFLLVREIVRALGAGSAPLRVVHDLGCGTGAGGAAWAAELPRGCEIAGIDRNGWAAAEARWNYRVLGLHGRADHADLRGARLGGRGHGLLASYTLNELDDADRKALLRPLLAAGERGARILVVEPIARRPFPWWDEWAAAFAAAGGRADEWRFAPALPERLRLFDKAARLDHSVLTGRSLWLARDEVRDS